MSVIGDGCVVHGGSDSIVTAHETENVAAHFAPDGPFVVRVDDKNGRFQHPLHKGAIITFAIVEI